MFTQVDTIQMRPDLTGLRYDATQSSPRRRTINVSTKSEDRELTTQGRQALTSQGRDLLRNLSIAGFAIRKHLQYVASFDFKCSVPGHPAYNETVKRWMYNWSRRQNCDLARRHSLPELITLIETHRVIDGDIGIIKLSNGRLQLVEGDRVRNPPKFETGKGYEWIHGVKVGNTGQAFKYAVHKRGEGGGFEFEREIPAENMILCGYYTRVDQIRGVPPISSAINQFQDVYEGIEYALAKAKVSQLLGVLTKTEDYGSLNQVDQAQEADDLKKGIKEKFGSGTIHFDFGPEDNVEMIESATPSTQFQDFIINVIQIALAALDIPYSFFDGSKTNYYGTRGALDNYIESCGKKQYGLMEALHEITDWRIRLAIMDGELPPPPGDMTVDELLWYCDWIGARMPFWRLIEDAKGYLVSMQSGLISPQKIDGMYGMDFDENLAEIKQARDRAKLANVQLAFMDPGPSNIGV